MVSMSYLTLIPKLIRLARITKMLNRCSTKRLLACLIISGIPLTGDLDA